MCMRSHVTKRQRFIARRSAVHSILARLAHCFSFMTHNFIVWFTLISAVPISSRQLFSGLTTHCTLPAQQLTEYKKRKK